MFIASCKSSAFTELDIRNGWSGDGGHRAAFVD